MDQLFSIKQAPDYGTEGLPQYDDISLYENELQRGVAKQGNDFFDSFTKDVFREPKKIPEYVFSKVFLPFFCGESTIEEAGVEITEGHWISFAEGPYMPVDVVNEEGEILFQVPPRYDNNTVHPSHVNDINNYVTVADHYRNLATSFPAQANAFLQNVLKERNEVMRTNIRTVEHLYAWNNILRRYGRPLIKFGEFTEDQLLGIVPLTETTESKKETKQDDEFSFEGF